ncbi:MAG: GNAT family N-acetyltransferase [Eubacteriales bacterium]|nr:GNAT family N-acetyltransferase [Eubacteriales bacterium]
MDSGCRLIIPTEEYLEQVADYRREFLDADSSMDGTTSLKRIADPKEWLENCRRYMDKSTVLEGMVQATQFIYVRLSDNRLIGMLSVRHYFNDYLEKYAGNIGYSVRPSERRKGYAKAMLRDCLPFCRSVGLDRILVCCLDDNVASRKTILANGGIFDDTVYEPSEKVTLERYWIEL